MNIVSKERNEYIRYILNNHTDKSTSDIDSNIIFNDGDIVNVEITRELIECMVKQITKVFNCKRKDKIKTFYFEFTCYYCGNVTTIPLSLSDFIDTYVTSRKQPMFCICKDCETKLDKEFVTQFEEIKRKIIDIYGDLTPFVETILKSSSEYIDYYTEPKKKIDPIQKEIYDVIFNRFMLKHSYMIERELKKLVNYQDFLNTPYWEYIRKRKFEQTDYKCEECGATEDLQVHHETYEHHYREHLYLNDLSTLCRNCHERRHTDDSRIEITTQQGKDLPTDM